MADISIHIDAKDYTNWLNGVPQKVTEAIAVSLEKIAFLVEREGKKRTPVDTGRLRSSISTDLYSTYATVHTNTKYAIFVHDGTRFIRPRPFMYEGAEHAFGQIDNIVLRELKRLE